MHKLKVLTISIILLLLLSVASPSVGVSASPLAATAPNLGTAASFSVLAQTAITNVPTSVLSGDVGLNTAGTNYTGLTSSEVGGTIYDTNGTGPSEGLLAPAVQADAMAAYLAIPGLPIEGTPIPGNLDGETRGPGVYDLGAGLLGGGVLTLSGSGVYIFRTSSSLTTSGSIDFINGADPCNLFWRVQDDATINGTSFAGTILAGTGIHIGANVTFVGRALAVGGDVTLISDTITVPVCAVITPPTAVPGGGGGGGEEEGGGRRVGGLPNTGGAPIRNDEFPWSLVVVGGLGAIALGLGVRSYRRRTH